MSEYVNINPQMTIPLPDEADPVIFSAIMGVRSTPPLPTARAHILNTESNTRNMITFCPQYFQLFLAIKPCKKISKFMGKCV